LQKKLGLKQNIKGPLICSVTRLAQQKGPDLIRYGLLRTLEKGGQFVLLASCPDPKIQKEFIDLKNSLEEIPNVAFHLDFNEELAHLLFAGSDYIFIPSISEPCGLTQMIACHYGTIPIARKTGGLADTVFDVLDTISPAKKNGFLFTEEDRDGVNHVIDRAFEFFASVQFIHLMKKNMQEDFSWEEPAKNYLSVYEQLLMENRVSLK
jgi:starch synthase